MLAAAVPSPLWYATRGAGMATLVLLTASLVLGIATSSRWGSARTPRFVVASWHRSLSLLALALLLVHIVSTVLDPFAQISPRDAVVPFGASYRPVWLGLGVLAAELLVLVALTSLVRARIGPRLWRALHWLAYAVWPVAVVHGLGTGSDAQMSWMIGLTCACVTAVVLALVWRLAAGRWRTLPLRAALAAVATLALALIARWAVQGPFQPGWSVASGTPTSILAAATPAPEPVHPPGRSFSDPLIGSMVRDAQGRPEIALRDGVDPGLTLLIRPPSAAETLPVLSVARNGATRCVAPAAAQTQFYAVCAGTRLTVTLYSLGGRLTGVLTASGPIN